MRRIRRIAVRPRPRPRHQALDERVGHALVDQHALDRRAPLSRILVRAGRGERRRFVEIGVLHDDDRIVAAELEHLPLVDRLGRDVLADRDAAGEGDEIDVRIGEHLVGDLARIAGHDRQHLRRQSGLVQQVGQQQRGERRFLGRLQHHPVVGRDRRRDLVRHLVQRMIERRDGGNGAEQRLAQRVHLARLAVRRQVAREHLAVVLQRRIAGEHEHVAGAADLVDRILLAQPGLGGDQVGDRVRAGPDQLGGPVHDLRALVARERRAIRLRDGERPPDIVDRGLGHRADDCLRVRVSYLDDAVVGDGLAGDAHGGPQRRATLHSGQFRHHVHRRRGIVNAND